MRLLAVHPRDVTTLSDAALLERYRRAGDETAFVVIAERHTALVFHACLRVLRDRTLAEDAAQETFFRLLRRPEQVQKSLSGWLHQTATTVAIDLLRGESRRRRRDRTYGQTATADATTWAELSPHVDEALEALPEDLRDLLVDHYLRGVTLTRSAADRGVSKATMSRRHDEALNLMRSHLASRGFSCTAAALAAVLAAPAAEAVPLALAAQVRRMTLAQHALTASPASLTAPTVTVTWGTVALGGAALTAFLVALMCAWWLLNTVEGPRPHGLDDLTAPPRFADAPDRSLHPPG